MNRTQQKQPKRKSADGHLYGNKKKGVKPYWLNSLNLLVAGAGFEPATFGLWARRATELLHPAFREEEYIRFWDIVKKNRQQATFYLFKRWPAPCLLTVDVAGGATIESSYSPMVKLLFARFPNFFRKFSCLSVNSVFLESQLLLISST